MTPITERTRFGIALNLAELQSWLIDYLEVSGLIVEEDYLTYCANMLSNAVVDKEFDVMSNELCWESYLDYDDPDAAEIGINISNALRRCISEPIFNVTLKSPPYILEFKTYLDIEGEEAYFIVTLP